MAVRIVGLTMLVTLGAALGLQPSGTATTEKKSMADTKEHTQMEVNSAGSTHLVEDKKDTVEKGASELETSPAEVLLDDGEGNYKDFFAYDEENHEPSAKQVNAELFSLRQHALAGTKPDAEQALTEAENKVLAEAVALDEKAGLFDDLVEDDQDGDDVIAGMLDEAAVDEEEQGDEDEDDDDDEDAALVEEASLDEEDEMAFDEDDDFDEGDFEDSDDEQIFDDDFDDDDDETQEEEEAAEPVSAVTAAVHHLHAEISSKFGS
jgi:hypothetical protein